ncbi:MAG: LacI family DNA-binding transcriptional regulator [Spirochaetales bacterium]|nr:LacI family DNA-binding transcriptional regulator [Spirochaetales bacterium]
MKPKLKDVAKIAGVSMTTASLVFSKQGRISEETRVKVLNAADFIGYSKKKKQSNMEADANIGILYSVDPEWAFILLFIRPIIAEIERELKKINLNTVLIPFHHEAEDDEIIDKLESIECKGVISIHYGKESLFSFLENSGIPVIVVMNNNYQNKFYSVCVDDFQGAYEGALHLLELGHTEIAFLDYQRQDLPMLSTDRFIGFKKALDEKGINFRESNKILYNPKDTDQCRKDLSILFGRKPHPTAIFCLDDDIAGRAIQLLLELGLNIPGDVSVIAPGDVLDYSMPYIPQITTMHIDTTYMGRISAQMMINRLTHYPEEVHVLKVKQQLVRRGSCRKI